MKKLKATALKIAGTILAACGITTTFTACYGMPINYDNYPELMGENVVVRADLNDDGEVTEDEDISSEVKMARIDTSSSEPDFPIMEIDYWIYPDMDGKLYFNSKGDYVFKSLDENQPYKRKIQTLKLEPGQVVILEKNRTK